LKVEDLRDNVLTVHTAKAGGLATRQLKISDKLVEKLKRYIIASRKEGYLFERNGKQLLSCYSKQVKSYTFLKT